MIIAKRKHHSADLFTGRGHRGRLVGRGRLQVELGDGAERFELFAIDRFLPGRGDVLRPVLPIEILVFVLFVLFIEVASAVGRLGAQDGRVACALDPVMADARYLSDFVPAAEGAVLASVVEDETRAPLIHAFDRAQLPGVGRIQVDGVR